MKREPDFWSSFKILCSFAACATLIALWLAEDWWKCVYLFFFCFLFFVLFSIHDWRQWKAEAVQIEKAKRKKLIKKLLNPPLN